VTKTFAIGVTGPTGAGKSTVCRIFAAYGCAVVDADQVARLVVEPDQPALKALHQLFPAALFQKDGTMDRPAMARYVFSDPEALHKLEGTLYPFIIDELKAQAEAAAGARAVILDAPTLFESGCDKLCAETLAVVAPQPIRLDRIIKRDGLSKEDALRRIRAQKDDEWYQIRAHYLLDGSRSIEFLGAQVNALLQRLGL